MPTRPHTILSCAVSIDGYLDDTARDRLILSGPEDLDEVDALRAAADAILVGAGTIRA
ncbi:MAG: dihydrofolate reductase family protein, partial [Trebonia sp.]